MANFDWVPDEYQGVFSYKDDKLVATCLDCGVDRQTAGKGAVLRDIEHGRGRKFLYCGSCRHIKGAKPTAEEVASWPEGHKRCVECREIKPFGDFHRHKACLFGYNTVCKACRVPNSRRQYADRTWEKKMFDRAKGRAYRSGREFTISVDDIVIPENCPVLGVPLDTTPGSPYVPSLDRKDSFGGYTPDNIIVMSRRANMLKNNMTLEECKSLLNYLEGDSI